MPALPADTLEDLESRAQDRHGLWGRRAAMGAVAVLVALGLIGWWGVRSGTASDEAGGWRLEVEYAEAARAGLDISFSRPPRAESAEVAGRVSTSSADSALHFC